MLEDAFAIKQALIEATIVGRVFILKHSLALVLVVSELPLITVAFGLVDLLSVPMTLIVPPLPRVNFEAVFKGTLSMRHPICNLPLVIGALCDESAVAPHIVVLPRAFVKGSVPTKDEDALPAAHSSLIRA